MARRLAAAVVMLVAGLGLLAAAVGADAHGESRKGGTLRLATFDEAGVSLDTGLAYANWAWVPIHATCAKLFTLDDAGADGLRVVPEVVDDLSTVMVAVWVAATVTESVSELVVPSVA